MVLFYDVGLHCTGCHGLGSNVKSGENKSLWRSRRPMLKLLTLKSFSSGLGLPAGILFPLLDAGLTVVTVERPCLSTKL